MNLEEHVRTLIAEEVAKAEARLRGELAAGRERSPWLAGAKAAADYLGWSPERIYKALPEIPHYRHGSRLMFRRDELDALIEDGVRHTTTRQEG